MFSIYRFIVKNTRIITRYLLIVECILQRGSCSQSVSKEPGSFPRVLAVNEGAVAKRVSSRHEKKPLKGKCSRQRHHFEGHDKD